MTMPTHWKYEFNPMDGAYDVISVTRTDDGSESFYVVATDLPIEDACLIGNARNMLEALEWALPYVERLRDAETIRNVIAKAKGVKK